MTVQVFLLGMSAVSALVGFYYGSFQERYDKGAFYMAMAAFFAIGLTATMVV